jgi:inner membrane protein
LLDYTNNYGLRPFFPFNPHWYAGSFVFIFDPLIFALLLGALLAPPLFGLISAEGGARRQPFRGRGWAIAALVGIVALWGWRAFEHQLAVQLALNETITATSPTADPNATPVYLQGQRALASPDMLSPFRWSTVTDFGPVYQMAEIDTRSGTVRPADSLESKPDRSAAVLAAEASPLGRVYMDWSPMPFVEVDRTGSAGESVVRFSDPRFMGGRLQSSGHSALSGSVTVSASGQVLRQSLDGRVEH